MRHAASTCYDRSRLGEGRCAELYLVLACLIILLGLVHVSATFALFDALTSRAVWFAGGGMAIIFTGVINLLIGLMAPRHRAVRWAGDRRPMRR